MYIKDPATFTKKQQFYFRITYFSNTLCLLFHHFYGFSSFVQKM